jgi:hypothetical protein
MSPQIARVRYYDGEYLGAGDFTAEQTYHLTMRRTLSRYLHLYGIVYGLNLTTDTEAGINSFAISAGLAIDAGGREIFLASPLPVTEAAFAPNRITSPGTYQVWVQYSEQASQVPANGYQLCNDNTQNTRWYETAQVLILSASNAPTPPAQSDLPLTSNIPGLLLGTMTVDNTMHISAVADDNANRLYIGLRAQQLISPADPGTNFNILNPQTATNPPVSLAAASNLFAQQNLITGPDFKVDQTKIKPAPPSTGFPKPAGNVKVGGDLFLSGELYSLSGANWATFDQRVNDLFTTFAKSVVPDIQAGIFSVPLDPTQSASPATGSFDIPITTPLTGKATMVVGVSEIEWLSRNDFATWATAIDADPLAKKIPGQVHVVVQTPPAQTSNGFDFTVKWTVGPTDTTDHLLPVSSLTISYIAIILPA